MVKAFDALSSQIRQNNRVNIFHPDFSENCRLEESFAEAIREFKSCPDNVKIDGMIDHAVREIIKNLLSVNQYIRVTEDFRNELASIYRETWEELLVSDDMENVLRTKHYPKIKSCIASVYPDSLHVKMTDTEEIGSVCCREYSPEMQMECLGIDPEFLYGPVLDVGCGYDATLVNYLLSQRNDVYGFDRMVRKQDGHVLEADWFSYDYTLQRWGTVLSHMGFSNHYRYACLNDLSLKSDMDNVFMNILSSLEYGGCFIYAPGVEELSALADSWMYQVTGRQVMDGYYVTEIRNI